MRILQEKTIALMIDMQEKLFVHIADHEMLLEQVKKIIESLKILQIPILITEQYRKGLGETLKELKDLFVSFSSFEKMSFSCMDDDLFTKELGSKGKSNVLLFGIESHVCVLQTAIDLKHKGYQPVVIEDGVSSRKLKDKQIAIERIRQEGAIVTTYESIVLELCRYAGSDKFKALSKLMK